MRCIIAWLITASILLMPMREAKGYHTLQQAELSARMHVVMIAASCYSSGAGIIVGKDNSHVYVATARHVVFPDSCSSTSTKVKFWKDKFQEGRPAQLLKSSKASTDLAVLSVDLDRELSAILGDFEVLAAAAPPDASRVRSLGYNIVGWSSGTNEVLLSLKNNIISYRSQVGHGQSGGGVFTESWDLLGMNLRAEAGVVTARTIQWVLATVRDEWAIPANLKPRSPAARARGDEEVARENLANLLAERARYAREEGDVLAAVTYLAQARQHAETPNVHAEALLVTEPPLVHVYSLMPQAGVGFTAVALHGGETLAVGSADGTVRLHRLQDGAVLRTLSKPGMSIIDSLVFSPDGRFLAGGYRTNKTSHSMVAIWSLDGASSPREIEIDNASDLVISALLFTEDPKRMIGIAGSALFVLDIENGREVWKQRYDRGGQMMTLRPGAQKGEYIASGPNAVQVVEFKNDSFSVRDLPTYPCSGGQFVYGTADVLVGNPSTIFRACDARLVSEYLVGGGAEKTIVGHSDLISEVVALPKRGLIVTGSWDGTVRVWDATKGDQLARSGEHHGGVRRIVATDEAERIVVLESNPARTESESGSGVRVWSYRSPVTAIPSSINHNIHPAILESGMILAGIDPAVMPQGVPYGIPPRGVPSFPAPGVLPGVPAPSSAPSKQAIAAAPTWIPSTAGVCWDANTNVLAYYTSNGTELMEFATPKFSPGVQIAARSDCLLAVVRDRSSVKLYRRRNRGAPWIRFADSTAPADFFLHKVAFSPTANVLVWSEQSSAKQKSNTSIWAWDGIRSPKLVYEKDGDITLGVNISSDGMRVAAHSLIDGHIRVWNWASGRTLLDFAGPTGNTELLFYKGRADEPLLLREGDGLGIRGMDGAVQRIVLRGASDTSWIHIVPGDELALVAGHTWRDGERSRIWLVDLPNQRVLTSALLPRTALWGALSNDGKHLLVGYGDSVQVLGFDLATTTDRVRHMTGERWTSTGLIADP